MFWRAKRNNCCENVTFSDICFIGCGVALTIQYMLVPVATRYIKFALQLLHICSRQHNGSRGEDIQHLVT